MPPEASRSGAMYSTFSRPSAMAENTASVSASVLPLVSAPGLDPRFAQRAHLVAHQRDQRRDDHRHALAHQRGQLEAQRLAAARRHDRQHVAACGHRLDDLLLSGAETVESPDLAQQVGGHHMP